MIRILDIKPVSSLHDRMRIVCDENHRYGYDWEDRGPMLPDGELGCPEGGYYEPENQVSVSTLLWGPSDPVALAHNPHVLNGRKIHDEIENLLNRRTSVQDIIANPDIDPQSKLLIANMLRDVEHSLHTSVYPEETLGLLVEYVDYSGETKEIYVFGTMDAYVPTHGFVEYKTSEKVNRNWFKQVLMYKHMYQLTYGVGADLPAFLVNFNGKFNADEALPDFNFNDELEGCLRDFLATEVRIEVDGSTLHSIQNKIEYVAQVLKDLEKAKSEELAKFNLDQLEAGKYVFDGFKVTRYETTMPKINAALVREKLPEAITDIKYMRNRVQINFENIV